MLASGVFAAYIEVRSRHRANYTLDWSHVYRCTFFELSTVKNNEICIIASIYYFNRSITPKVSWLFRENQMGIVISFRKIELIEIEV